MSSTNNYPPIIALHGKRGAGKDTAAGIVRDLTKGQALFQTLRFAGILKSFVADWLDRPVEDLDRQEVKAEYIESLGMTVGELLQKVGHGLRELVHEDFWVIGTMNRVQGEQQYLCLDCRYPNEKAAIEARGGVVLRIEGDPQGQRGDGTRNDADPSEISLDGEAMPTVRNDSSLFTLRARLAEVLLYLRAGGRPLTEVKTKAFTSKKATK